MIDAVAAIAEAAIALALVTLEVVVVVLVASIRPWRYVLSSIYRSEVDARLSDQGMVCRVWYFAWGTLALFASVAVIGVLVWFFWPEPADRRNDLSVENTQKVIERVRTLKGDK